MSSHPLSNKDIAAIIRGASKYYLRQETAAGRVLTEAAAKIEATASSDNDLFLMPDADDTRFRSRLEKIGDKFNKDQAETYVNQIVDEVIFLAGGEDATDSAGYKLSRTHIEDYVRINIFQGASYTEGTGIFINAPVLQPFASGESWQNFANMELNRKSKELERDPSMPLFEHKLRHVLVEIVESNPNLEPLAGLILSADVLKADGIAPPDRTDDDYAGAMAFYSDDVGQILNYTKESIRNESYSFLDGTGRGNFGGVLSGAVREDLYDFVGPIPQTTQPPSIDHKRFMTNDEYFNKTIDIWLEENGAIINPSDDQSSASDPYLTFGYASANRKFKEKYLKSRTKYIENSDMNKTANKGAEKEGLDTDQWIAAKIFGEVQGDLTIAEGEEESEYESIASNQAEWKRLNGYQHDPQKAGKDLKAALALNPDLWVDSPDGKLPVDDKRVNKQTWADWVQKYATNPKNEVMEYIGSQIIDAVKAGFKRSEAESQAKDLIAQMPGNLVWADLSVDQQQTVIDAIHERGGISISQALAPRVEPPLFLQESQYYESGYFDEAALERWYEENRGGLTVEADFANSIMEYAQSGITEQALVKTIAKPESMIFNMLKDKGLISSSSNMDFLAYLNENVIPEMTTRVGLSGATSIPALRQEIDGLIEALPAYQINEADYQRQMDPSQIPGFAGMPGGYVKPEPPVPGFDFDDATPAIQELAIERPEFAKYVLDQMTLPGFAEGFRDVSVPQVDEERLRTTISGGPDPGSVEFEQQVRKLEAEERLYDRTVNEGLADQATYDRFEKAQTQFEKETGRATPTTSETPAVDAGFLTGGFAKQAAIKQFTTPAQTSAQFFESKLPGFERRFEESPFFKLEQERTEREGEAKAEDQRIEESRLETERRRKLRGGVGAGRGRTIITRGRA
tara:strand:- start:4918 stop:7659 length:2742 start_codon:yes stop_codon:yes gene_type:complete